MTSRDPAFVVNVEVFLHRGGRWLLIRRGDAEAHAAGTLAGVGGKVEAPALGPEVLEATARREVREEIGVALDGVPLLYADSSFFIADDGDQVVNVVFVAQFPDDARPAVVSPEEVSEIVWLTASEVKADQTCPPWIQRSLAQADTVRAA